MTISKAYSYLEKEGVVERRPGLPLVVADLQPRRLQEQKLERLRESLAAPAAIVRQLGIDHREAALVFEEMLDGLSLEGAEKEAKHEDN